MNLNNVKEDVIKALLKKAKGYSYNEECTEFSYNEEGEKINKKKITTKIVPPDLSALKGAMELLKEEQNEIESLTDEELEESIFKLLEELNKSNKNAVNDT